MRSLRMRDLQRLQRDVSYRLFTGGRRYTLIFAGRQNVRGRERRLEEYWQKFGFDSCL